MNVTFCNSNAFKIDTPELKEKVYLECEKIFNTILKRNYFPGPQPVAIEMKDIEKLKENYMVCEKTDGERAILLLINIDNKPMCFIINRNNELYFMDLSFKKEVFEGSIFDGELIKTKEGVWNYLIHDCMSYNGTSFLKNNHCLRYSAIIDLIVKRYVNKEKDPFNVKTKLFYKYGKELNKTWDHIQKTTENKIDGLIFTPIDGPIIFGRDNSLFKWKEENTMDLLVKKESDRQSRSIKKINVYYQKKSELVLYKTISKENEKLITDFLTKDQLKKGAIVEFKFENDLFVPFRLRTDKDKPNGEITIKNTMINIEEAITIGMLCNNEPDLNFKKLQIE
jgi:hypothetical protein